MLNLAFKTNDQSLFSNFERNSINNKIVLPTN